MDNRFAQLFDIDGHQVLVMINMESDEMNLEIRTLTMQGLIGTTVSHPAEDRLERIQAYSELIKGDEPTQALINVVRLLWERHGGAPTPEFIEEKARHAH